MEDKLVYLAKITSKVHMQEIVFRYLMDHDNPSIENRKEIFNHINRLYSETDKWDVDILDNGVKITWGE